jgi:hypothetical protein
MVAESHHGHGPRWPNDVMLIFFTDGVEDVRANGGAVDGRLP